MITKLLIEAFMDRYEVENIIVVTKGEVVLTNRRIIFETFTFQCKVVYANTNLRKRGRRRS